MKTEKFVSPFDGLELELAISEPDGTPVGIVQFSHGMAEHKERYFDFMDYLTERGFLCVIHDHRGHGGSVKSPGDYGYFYTEDKQAIVEDQHGVTLLMKERYPGVPVYLFSHSMGTLVSREYIKKYDGDIDRLVLCGPPTSNPAVGAAIVLAKLSKLFDGGHKPNKLINGIAFSSYNKGHDTPNGWLSYNTDNVKAYNADPKSGYMFTTNGFINMLGLLKSVYETEGWKVNRPELPILVIAGEDDPVIASKEKFDELTAFLKERGYRNVKSALYPHMRHEVLNEDKRLTVYKDLENFFGNP